MQPTVQQLRNEINLDPVGLGYAPLKEAGDYLGIVAKLNATRAGVGVVWRTNMTGAEVLGCLVWSEIAALTTNNWLALQTLLIPSTPIDASNARIRAFFAGLFPNATFPLTLTNLTAMGQKPNPTRAEELWGFGTVIAEQDVANAVNS
jgi:hypothetical protein